MAQLKGDKLTVVPSTADGLRAAVSALWSLDWKNGVSFHTFTLPKDRCERLLMKNLGRGKPESVVRQEIESLTKVYRESRSCDPSASIRTPPRIALPPPTSLCQWRDGLTYKTCDRSSNSAACECRWSRIWLQKPAAMQALPALRPHAAWLRLRNPVRRLWGFPPLRWMLYPTRTA